MANQGKRKTNLKARAFVIFGTLLAGLGIWTGITKPITPSSAQVLPATPGITSNYTVQDDSGDYVIPSAQSGLSSGSVLSQPRVVPRLRTRGS